MILEGKIGPQELAKGAAGAVRLARDGSVVLSSRYRELAREGRVFSAVTAAGGVAPGTAIGTTAAFALWLPSQSPVVVELIRVSMGYLSGTLGAGHVALLEHKRSETAFSGTEIQPIGARGFNRGAYARAYTTATVPAAGLACRLLGTLGAKAAATALESAALVDRIDGEIQLTEGCGLSIQAIAAAGTSPLVVFEAVWAEIPADL